MCYFDKKCSSNNQVDSKLLTSSIIDTSSHTVSYFDETTFNPDMLRKKGEKRGFSVYGTVSALKRGLVEVGDSVAFHCWFMHGNGQPGLSVYGTVSAMERSLVEVGNRPTPLTNTLGYE